MTLSTIIFIFGSIITALLLFIILRSRGDKNGEDFIVLKEHIKHLQDELRQSTKSIEHRLTESNRTISEDVKFQVTTSQKLIKDITEKLGEVTEANNQVFSMTEQLSNLEKVLTNQKQRGSWGEGSLELILSNTVPSSYEMQYRFSSDSTIIVDAVITIKDKLLPIDSKFSLENYQRCIDAENDDDKKFFAEEFKKDMKTRIDETSKYIRENDGTLPIAFMFIPSEAIYYDLLAGEQSRIKVNTQRLIEYAQSRKVFIVSPTSILPYLFLVLSGIKAFNIDENSKQIRKNVEDLSKHLTSYDEYMRKLGVTLGTTVSHYQHAYTEFKKIDKDVARITGEGMGIDPLLINKPITEEE